MCSLDLRSLEIDAASSIYRGGLRCCGYVGFGLADAERAAHMGESSVHLFAREVVFLSMSRNREMSIDPRIVSISPLPDIIENRDLLSLHVWGQRLLAWHVKESPEVIAAFVSHLAPRQVLPDYQTLELPGVHKLYEEEGLDLLLHQSSVQGILGLAIDGATLSLIERMSRDPHADGQSVEGDLEHGGANSVFLSMLTKGPGRAHFRDPWMRTWNRPEAFIVYKHELLDRIDWFAYDKDEFGETSERVLDRRPSPLEFFRNQYSLNRPTNEIMMPHGIANEDIDCIVLQTEDGVQAMVDMLRDRGISQIGGRSLENILITKEQFAQRRMASAG